MHNLKLLAEHICSGKRRAIAKGITLAESQRSEDQQQSRELQSLIRHKNGRAIRIGISGIPGAGKSSLIECFGSWLLKRKPEMKIAVLAIDPSSPVHGGSLLGDKTRMETLSVHPRAFIRPSPGGGGRGGVSRYCRESLAILDAAGYQLIFVETIGAGQAEYQVAAVTDLFILMQVPCTGDALQGMKKGALELADIILIHKADGMLRSAAQEMASDFSSTKHSPQKGSQERPVLLVSSEEGRGLKELLESMERLIRDREQSGELQEKRNHQLIQWLHDEIRDQFWDNFQRTTQDSPAYKEQLEAILASQISPGEAATALLHQIPRTES
ncbi:MAG: methylmalonyl Co-A mutase-associated GTPase MeaB [Deltaproteobacteria bacterium]|nr:methylmalonyl Co-A mutase-associated GTPase MeaB [Deltaproteobacteria bacterium]